jgi:hypothetical protein
MEQINSLSLSVSQSWAWAGTGHGLGMHWARTGHGLSMGKGGLGRGGLSLEERHDTGRLGTSEHNTSGLGTGTGLGMGTCELGMDWARASWARSECVRTSQVPTSGTNASLCSPLILPFKSLSNN